MDWKFSSAIMLLIMGLKKLQHLHHFYWTCAQHYAQSFATRPQTLNKMALIDFFIHRNPRAHLHTHHNHKGTNKSKQAITKITFYFNHISTHLILFTTEFNRIFGSDPYSWNNIYTTLPHTSKLIFPIVYQLLYSNRNFNADRLFSRNNLRVHCIFNIFLYLCWVQENDYVINSSHPRPSSSLLAEVSYWVCLYLRRHYDTTWGLPEKASLFYFPVVANLHYWDQHKADKTAQTLQTE